MNEIRTLSVGKAIVLMIAPSIVFAILYLCYRLLGGSPADFNSNAIRIGSYILQFITVLLIFYGVKKYSFSVRLGREKLKAHKFLIVFLLFLCFALITPLLRNLNLFFIKDTSSLMIAVKNDTVIGMADYIVGSIILAPIVEELFYKNIFDKLRKNYSILLSMFWVSLFFTLPHLTQSNWHSFFSYFAYSAISCVVFLRTQSFVLCIFLHSLLNISVLISAYYNNFLYENIFTQKWYVLLVVFSFLGIYELLQRLRK